MAMATFAGSFRGTDEATSTWECPICWSLNMRDSDGSVRTSCKTCKGLRRPQWLLVEQHELQIELGSRVLHTSPGGSKSVSVVVAINYVQKIVTLLRVRVKRGEYDSRDHHSTVSFHEIALNAAQVHEQLEPLGGDLDDGVLLDKYGICGDCRGVFHIEQGDSRSKYATEDKIAELRKEIEQLGQQKQRLAREKAYDRALECSEEMKLRSAQLQVAARDLQFLDPVFCPFCGWSSAGNPQETSKQE